MSGQPKIPKFRGNVLEPTGQIKIVTSKAEHGKATNMWMITTTVEDELGFRFSVTAFAGGYMGSSFKHEGNHPEGVLLTYVFVIEGDKPSECWNRRIEVCADSLTAAQAFLVAETPRFAKLYKLKRVAPPSTKGAVAKHWS